MRVWPVLAQFPLFTIGKYWILFWWRWRPQRRPKRDAKTNEADERRVRTEVCVCVVCVAAGGTSSGKTNAKINGRPNYVRRTHIVRDRAAHYGIFQFNEVLGTHWPRGHNRLWHRSRNDHVHAFCLCIVNNSGDGGRSDREKREKNAMLHDIDGMAWVGCASACVWVCLNVIFSQKRFGCAAQQIVHSVDCW